jgi:hypothetical protein
MKQPVVYRSAWHKATADVVVLYQNILSHLLDEINLPHEALVCDDKSCVVHGPEIDQLHDNIINALLQAGTRAIPVVKPPVSKIVTGWNEYVDQYFRSSLLWHDIWKANGQPSQGIIADLHKKTRSEYHKICKMVMRREGEIKSDKMAEALSAGNGLSFWKEVTNACSKKVYYPGMVDDVVGVQDIAAVFAEKFDILYNCVSYNTDDIKVLKNYIDNAIYDMCKKCNCIHDNHSISIMDVKTSLTKLQSSKSDGSTQVLSDHFIHAGNKLYIYISLLFTAMLRHGTSPEGMVLGTMVPIPKGRWANLTNSDNFRAITLSSILGKLFDYIVLVKEESHLCTSNLQFSFKKGASTSLCTAMIQETVSYFVHGGSNVYSIMLDASKAFDRVNYCKLFRVLLDRGVCPLYCRLLLNMYTTQKLRVRWNTEYSDNFSASNGVKQGGVISPVLFCVYTDGLLMELEKSGVGCYMASAFAGAFAYADDLKILTPSVGALQTMTNICVSYADKYDILFNGKKSLIIIYRTARTRPPDPIIIINGAQIKCVKSVIHLGHLLSDNIYNFDISKCINDFNCQSNMFMADFKYTSSEIRNVLFHKHCTSFYGSQILPLFDNVLNGLCRAWRVAIRRVWRIPWQTHCDMLPHLADVMDPELWLSKRCIKFIEMAMKSDNSTVKTIANMGIYSSYSIMGGNFKHLRDKYGMNANKVNKQWNESCFNNEFVIRTCMQVKELIYLRDRCMNGFLNRNECNDIIYELCTGDNF